MGNFTKDIEMLKYFQDEFKYRHTHFWNILIKFFMLSVTIAVLPMTSSIFGIELNDMARKMTFVFPFVAVGIAFLGRYILNGEAKRLYTVQEAKYRVSRGLEEQYQYYFWNNRLGNAKELTEQDIQEGGWLVFKIARIAFSVELAIAVMVVLFLIHFS